MPMDLTAAAASAAKAARQNVHYVLPLPQRVSEGEPTISADIERFGRVAWREASRIWLQVAVAVGSGCVGFEPD
jgi:hypothetical protein